MVWSIWRRFTGLMEPASDSESLADGLDDMIFFERRLNEVITGMQPKAMKWIFLLLVVFTVTMISAYYWVMDPSIRYISFYESLWKHPFFSAGFVTLMVLFTVCGVQKRVIAPSIIAARCRSVLVDFYLSCDEQGRLIVRPTHGLGSFGSTTTLTSGVSSSSNTTINSSVLSNASTLNESHLDGGGGGSPPMMHSVRTFPQQRPSISALRSAASIFGNSGVELADSTTPDDPHFCVAPEPADNYAL